MSTSNIRVLPASQSSYVVCPANQSPKSGSLAPLSQLAALTSSIQERVHPPQPIIMILPPPVTQASNISLPSPAVYSSTTSSSNSPSSTQPVIQSSKVSTSTTHSKFVPIQQALTKSGTSCITSTNTTASHPSNVHVSSQFVDSQASSAISQPVWPQSATSGSSYPLAINSSSSQSVTSSLMQTKHSTLQTVNLQSDQLHSSNIISIQPSQIPFSSQNTTPQTFNSQSSNVMPVHSPDHVSSPQSSFIQDCHSNISSGTRMSSIVPFQSTSGSNLTNFSSNQSPSVQPANMLSAQNALQSSNVMVIQPSAIQSSNMPSSLGATHSSNIMLIQPSIIQSPSIVTSGTSTQTQPSNIVILQPSTVSSNMVASSYNNQTSNVMMMPSIMTSSLAGTSQPTVVVLPPTGINSSNLPSVYNTQPANMIIPCSLVYPSNLCTTSLNPVMPANVIPSSESPSFNNAQKSDIPTPVQQSVNQSGIMTLPTSLIPPSIQLPNYFGFPSAVLQSPELVYLSQPQPSSSTPVPSAATPATTSCLVSLSPSLTTAEPEKCGETSLEMTVDVDPSDISETNATDDLMLECESEECHHKAASGYEKYILPDI